MATKTTSRKVASTASRILRNDNYGKSAKSVAGSALSQRETSKKAASRKAR